MKSVIFLLILMICLVYSCGTLEDSSNELIRQSSNSNGKKALVFIKFGGATVDNSLHVAIMQDGDSINSKVTGNIFIADDSTGSVGKDDVRILWRHSDTLEVFYNNRLRVFKNEQQVIGVKILYSQVE
jgi:hypothetical protein